MSALAWLTPLTDDFNYLLNTLPTTTLFLDRQRGTAHTAGREFALAALCLNEAKRPCGQCKSCHLFHQTTHPDFIVRQTPSKIDDIRELSALIQRTPNISAKRIIFLPDIDRYNDFALNALLKTLEEPPPSNHFILSAPNRRAVKATILSRARCLTLPSPKFSQAKTWLIEHHGWQEDKAIRALTLHNGDPYKALTQKDGFDPSTHINLCIAYLAEPKQNTTYLAHIDSIDASQLIDYVSAQLYRIITYIQLDGSDEYWQNYLSSWHKQITVLDLARLHTLYARIIALRSPSVKQVSIAANIKSHLLEVMDNPIPIL